MNKEASKFIPISTLFINTLCMFFPQLIRRLINLLFALFLKPDPDLPLNHS